MEWTAHCFVFDGWIYGCYGFAGLCKTVLTLSSSPSSSLSSSYITQPSLWLHISFPFFKNNLLCSWSYSTLIFCRAFLFLSCSSVHNSSHTYNKPFFMPKNSDQPKLNFNEKLLLQLLPVHIYQYCIPWRDLGLCIYSCKLHKLHLFL